MKKTIENIYARRNFGDLSGYQAGEIKRALAAAYRAGRKGGLTKRAADLLRQYAQQMASADGRWDCPNGDAKWINANSSNCPVCHTARR